jgi:hypothetical protein
MAEPLLLDRFMPEYDFSIVFSRVLRALPERSSETVVGSDLFEIPLFRLLIGARGIPQLLADAGQRRDEDPALPSPGRRSGSGTFPRSAGSSSARDLVRSWPSVWWARRGAGVAACPSRSHLTRSAASTSRASPRSWRATRVYPYGERASVVTAESRVLCTDEDSRRRVQRYWLAVTTLTHLMRLIALPSLARKVASASGPAA